MKYEVVKDFFDKNTGDFHSAGSLYEAGSERGNELQEKGFLSEALEDAEQETPKKKKVKK
jgi:hypothetical protein